MVLALESGCKYGNTDEASLAHLLLTSFCATRCLTVHRPHTSLWLGMGAGSGVLGWGPLC